MGELGQIPSALPPIYATAHPNAPVHLYSGSVQVDIGGTSFKEHAQIGLEWKPDPRVVVRMISDNRDWLSLASQLPVLSLIIPEMSLLKSNAQVISYDHSANAIVAIFVEPCSMEVSSDCSSLIFQVINFLDYVGQPLSYGDRHCPGRLELATPEWQVVIDAVPDCKELTSALEREGGFGITHTGRIMRHDASSHGIDSAKEVLSAVRSFLSFCRGRRIGVPTVRGLDESGESVYEQWQPPYVSRWKGVHSWFPDRPTHGMNPAFTRFLCLWADEDWRDTLSSAIHWYVNANENTAALQGSIVLAQIALERLAWMLMVNDKSAISPNGFDRLSAADKLSLLFHELAVPQGLPQSLTHFTAYGRHNNISSIAEGIAHLRNMVVHPPRKNRASVPRDALVEIWKATVWSLELSVLALLGYRGEYYNWMNPEARWRGQTELVPWAHNSGTTATALR